MRRYQVELNTWARSVLNKVLTRDQSAIFIMSSSGTLLLMAAVVDAPLTECALKTSVSIPAFVKRVWSQRLRVGDEISL